jgi:hypothetical protein
MGRDAARLSQVPRRRGGAVSGSQQRGVSAGGGPRVGTRMTMLPATHLAMAATRFEADAVRSTAPRDRRRDAAHFALREGGGAVLRGVVRDRDSGAPVAGVIVAATSGRRRVSATTAVDGSYELEVETGAWTLTFDVGWGVIARRPEPAARGWVRIVNQAVAAGPR